MSTAKIFAYKGNVGIVIDPIGKFLNNPFDDNQLGAVIRTDEVEISKEAKDIIRAARRQGGSFAELMLTDHEGGENIAEHGKSSIAVLGMGYVHLGTDFCIGRMCTTSILEDCVEVPNDPPADYQNFIDTSENFDME